MRIPAGAVCRIPEPAKRQETGSRQEARCRARPTLETREGLLGLTCQNYSYIFLTVSWENEKMQYIANKVIRRIRGKGRGSVFVPKDFLDLGRRAAVDQALSRLVKAGTIRR